MVERLNTPQAAAFLGVSTSTLKRARNHSVGPPATFELGYGYLYAVADLEPYRGNHEALRPPAQAAGGKHEH